MFDVYLITPDGSPEDILDRVTLALDAELPERSRLALQLRAKSLPEAAFRRLACSVRALTRARGIPMLVNGRLDAAAEVGAEGAHLPEAGPSVAEARLALGASAVVGVSCHDALGLARAAAAGASFAVLSPIDAVDGKASPLGVAGFERLVRGSALPVIALGGVRSDHVRPLVAAGARGIAVTRAVFEARAPATALRDLLRDVAEARDSKV